MQKMQINKVRSAAGGSPWMPAYICAHVKRMGLNSSLVRMRPCRPRRSVLVREAFSGVRLFPRSPCLFRGLMALNWGPFRRGPAASRRPYRGREGPGRQRLEGPLRF